MADSLRLRWRFVAFGVLAGLVLWGLTQVSDSEAVPERLVAAARVATVGFFGTVLLMTGRTAEGYALRAAALVGLLGLLGALLVGFRFAGGADPFDSFGHFMALWVVVLGPLPFLIAQAGPGWRDYPTLFEESWSAAIRGMLAWVFVGVVWLLIFLSTTLLDLVGVEALAKLVEHKLSVMVISGASLGLGLAVVSELQNRIPSRLVVRLLRLVTPGVLVVAVVFVLALLLRGFELKDGWSAGRIILAMAALSIMLVTLVADKHGAKESDSRVLRVSARWLALMVPVLAGLALWTVLVRVGQYGWMPDRVLAALLAGLGLVYGVVYGLAALRRGGWMARVRAANPWLMLVVLAAALLWLSPLVNAERISAVSQKARILAGGDGTPGITHWKMRDLGLAGQEALDEIAAFGVAEGRDDLVAWAAGDGGDASFGPTDTTALQKQVAAVLPLIPVSATGTRDVVLAAMGGQELRDLLGVCEARLPDGAWSCVLVVADLIPAIPGDEAVLGTRMGGWNRLEGLIPNGGNLTRAPMRTQDGRSLNSAEVVALMLEWQTTPPVVAPVALNQLGAGPAGLVLLP